MAVDTRDKRFSILGLHQPVPSLTPNPDGTVGTADRAMWLFLYHGIGLSGPGGAASLLVFDRAFSRLVFGRIFGRVN